MPYTNHPRAAVTADVVLVAGSHGARSVLLIRRGNDPFAGSWALPGGFVDQGERIEDAARRELAEETGVRFSGPLHQVGAFGDPGRDPRGWTVSVAWLGDVGEQPVSAQGGDDAASAEWFPLSALPALAFDHDHIVARAMALLGEELD